MTLLLLRTLPWRAFGFAAAIAAVAVAVRPEVSVFRACGGLVAAAAGLFCDDPAEALTDATPTRRAVRRGARFAVAAAATYAVWLALLPLVSGVDVPAVAEEVAFVLAVALAAGTRLGGTMAAPAVVVMLVAVQHLSPHVSHVREAVVAGSLAVLALALRDPAARSGRRATPAGKIA